MDHINAVRAALKAAAPVVAIPIEGRAPVCIKARLLKGALKGVTIASVTLLDNGWLKITGTAQGGVRTSCSLVPMGRMEALRQIQDWTIKERDKRIKVINQGVLSAQAQRELKKQKIEGEAALVLKQAMEDETRILADAKDHVNPVLYHADAESRARITADYLAFREQRGKRKRGAVIQWMLAKLRKEKAEMVKVQRIYEEVPGTLYRRRHKVLKSKVTVLRRKKDAVKYAALVYQIGKLEKQFQSLYPDILGRYGWREVSWINKRTKEQTVNARFRGWDSTDRYDRRAEALRLKDARANIRALTPPADDEQEQNQIAA